MTAFEGMDPVGTGLVFCAVMLLCLGLAVACAPAAPARRLPALAKRNRAGAGY